MGKEEDGKEEDFNVRKSTVATFNSTRLNVLRKIYRKEAMRTVVTPEFTNGVNNTLQQNGRTQQHHRAGKPRIWNWNTLGRVLARIAVNKFNLQQNSTTLPNESKSKYQNGGLPITPDTTTSKSNVKINFTKISNAVQEFFTNQLGMNVNVKKYRIRLRNVGRTTGWTVPTGKWPMHAPAIIRNDPKTEEKGNNLFSQPSLLRNRQKNMLRLQKTKGWRVEMMQRPSSTNSMQDLSEKNSNLFRSSRASSAEGSSRGSTRMNDNNLLM